MEQPTGKDQGASIRLDPHTHQRVKVYAVMHMTSIQAICSEAVNKHIDALEAAEAKAKARR